MKIALAGLIVVGLLFSVVRLRYLHWYPSSALGFVWGSPLPPSAESVLEDMLFCSNSFKMEKLLRHRPLGSADAAHREAQSGCRINVSTSFKIIMRIYLFTPLLRLLTLGDSKGLVSHTLLFSACPQPVLCHQCLPHSFPYLGSRLYFHQQISQEPCGS